MTTVEKLTKVVKRQSKALVAADHTGVSDHLMHIQKVTLKTGSATAKFYLGTFNVLAQEWVWYQSGKKPDGSPTPSWYNLEGQQGLENTPLADESLAQQRKDAIVSMIVKFFERSWHPAVLCLQECDFSIVKEVSKSVPSLTVQYDSHGSPGKVTMSRNAGALGPADYNTGFVMCTLIEPEEFGRNIVIANVHLDFNTNTNEKEMEELKAFAKHRPLFVVGDYNIPCMPISDRAKNDGSTKTLTEFVNEIVCGRLGWKYALAEHIIGYTNFNCRKNCVDPAKNADHFDNILFLHAGDYDVEFIPSYAPDEGVWWKK